MPDEQAAEAPGAGAQDAAGAIGGRYARYTLGVLVVVYVLNFLDRQIISVLSVKIQADLGIDDAQIGFLYGTAFAVFYAIFGIPLGRLADVWVRRSLIAAGLAFWSGMTTLSGFAANFTQLAIARVGVGVGEASATPAAFSMLSDTFPAERRATALSIYSSGLFLGAGLGLFLGGAISTAWDEAWAGSDPPFGLVGWRVAFIMVGLPGVLVALWVRSLREPVRGRVDGIAARAEPHPFRIFGRELCTVIPGLAVAYLLVTGAGASIVAVNLASGGALLVLAWLLVEQTGDTAQWIALAIGLYAAVSWAQSLALRDRPAFSLIFGTPTLRTGALGFSCLAFVGYGLGFWVPPYAIRELGVSEAEAGLWLGGSGALGGFIGVTLGGILADRLRVGRASGRITVGLLNAVLPLPLAWWMLQTENVVLFYLLSLPLNVVTSLWIGPGASTIQDLVLPRMRATASAAYLLAITFIGLALGPYTIGRLSVALGDLGEAMRWGLAFYGPGFVLLLLAARSLGRDEETLRDRARAAGEPGV